MEVPLVLGLCVIHRPLGDKLQHEPQKTQYTQRNGIALKRVTKLASIKKEENLKLPGLPSGDKVKFRGRECLMFPKFLSRMVQFVQYFWSVMPRVCEKLIWNFLALFYLAAH